jgi:hypothetical protein
MFVSLSIYRDVVQTSAFKNLHESEIMRNDLNQSKNLKQIETTQIKTNSFSDELKENFDTSKMFMLNLNERLE